MGRRSTPKVGDAVSATPYRVASFFAGIGGFDLGFERAGLETVWQCEKKSFCLDILEKHWPEVYRKIRDAGKLIQVFGKLDVLDVLAEQLGSTRGIYLHGSYDISQADAVMCELERYGAC